MTLLAITYALYTEAMKDESRKSIIINNSPNMAKIVIEDFVYKSVEYREWLYEFIDTDMEITNFRFINDAHAITIISKHILKKMNRALAIKHTKKGNLK
jgi:hypothetical protein